MSRLIVKSLVRIRKERRDSGISQREAAKIIGCNQSQYGKKERGEQQFTLLEYWTLREYYEELKKLSEPGQHGQENPFRIQVL